MRLGISPGYMGACLCFVFVAFMVTLVLMDLTWYVSPLSGYLLPFTILILLSGICLSLKYMVENPLKAVLYLTLYVSLAALSSNKVVVMTLNSVGFQARYGSATNFLSNCALTEVPNTQSKGLLGNCGFLWRSLDSSPVNFVYDSTDEIAKPMRERSSKWIDASKKLQSGYVTNEYLSEVGTRLAKHVYAVYMKY